MVKKINSPREMTTNEVRDAFLMQLIALVDYWAEYPNMLLRDRLSGILFSVLSTLDGCSGGVPGFIVAPLPHPDDKGYSKEKGDNWYPENDPIVVNSDIGGSLHERLCELENEFELGDKIVEMFEKRISEKLPLPNYSDILGLLQSKTNILRGGNNESE